MSPQGNDLSVNMVVAELYAWVIYVAHALSSKAAHATCRLALSEPKSTLL